MPRDDHYRTIQDIVTSLEVQDPFVVQDGLPRSIFEDKYARKIYNTSPELLAEPPRFETWEEVARRVVGGNFSLIPRDIFYALYENYCREVEDSTRLAVEGVMCFSGRHLQHGDWNQKDKILDLFSNCSASPFSFITLWKSLCGKGVSSDYSSHVRPVNWDNMPNFRVILNGGIDDSGEVGLGSHPDFKQAIAEFQGGFESLRDAQHKYPSNSEWVRWFKAEDSREGWAQAVCALETAAYHERHKDKLFLFDFSDVREAGRPIMGHQGRPASGPVPLMRCLLKVATIKGAFMAPWQQAMYIDDYLAQCVSIGGVRRNARMAVMWWRDSNIFDFIEIKRGGHLRMANNTILVDHQFHEERKDPRTHAYRVFQAASAAGFLDHTGEPGLCNVHNMRQNRKGLEHINAHNYLNLEASGLKLHPRTYDLIQKVLDGIKGGSYISIPNPCSEANLNSMGDDCIVGDIGLQRAKTIKDAQKAAELMGRSLVRVSGLMPALCEAERKRTNKVGVSAIGILEFFWNHFKLGFYDLISAHDYFICPEKTEYDYETKVLLRSIEAWKEFGRISKHAVLGAEDEAERLGLTKPDVVTLLKPGGTVAKVFQAMESANLPGRKYDLRNTQHVKEIDTENGKVPNPKVDEYRRLGYPIKDISHKYPGYVIVGFPRCQTYVRMLEECGAGDKVVTANNVSIEDHFKWLRLLEYHWLGRDKNEPLNGQLSYTLKFNPRKFTFEEFMKVVGDNIASVRTCTYAVSSSDEEIFDETKKMIENYGWVPEEPITKEQYDEYISRIAQAKREEYSDADALCEAGVCSIDGNIN